MECQAQEAVVIRNDIAQSRSNEFGSTAVFYGCKNCELSMGKYNDTLKDMAKTGNGYAELQVQWENLNIFNNQIISNINFDLYELSLQISSLRNELASLKSALDQAKNRSDSLKQEIRSRIRKEDDYIRQAERLVSNFNELKRQVQGPHNQLINCMKEINANSKQIEVYRQSTPGAEHTPPKLLKKHSDYLSEGQSNYKEYSILKDQLEVLMSKTSRSLDYIATEHRENNDRIKMANEQLAIAGRKIEKISSDYSEYSREFSNLKNKIKSKTDELNRVDKKDRWALEKLKHDIEFLKHDTYSLESKVQSRISEVGSTSAYYQIALIQLNSITSLDSIISETRNAISSGNNLLSPILDHQLNICRVRDLDNNEIAPIKKFLKYRKKLDREISKTPFTGSLKTTIPMKGYNELVYLKKRQDIVMNWNTVEDPDRAHQIFQTSDQLINFSDDFLSTSPTIDDSFLDSMKSTISTMQDYGAGALSLAIGFVPYVNHIKDLLDVLQGKDTITGEKYGPEIRMIIMGTMLLPISATAVKPFVEKIAPTIMRALKIAENPFTRKILDAAERLGIKETKEIVRNVRVLERIESDFEIVGTRSADELNAIEVSIGREPPYEKGGLVFDVKLTKYEDYVRSYGEETKPNGTYLMTMNDIEGLDAIQIQQEYNIEYPITKIAKARLPPGTNLRISGIGINRFGKASGRVQYQILDKVRSDEWFTFWRDL